MLNSISGRYVWARSHLAVAFRSPQMKTALTFLSLIAIFSLQPALQAQSETAPATAMTEAEAEAAYQQFIEQFGWQESGRGQLAEWSTIDLPDGFRFLNGAETDELMQAFGNIPDDYDGMVAVKDVDWFVLFQFAEVGYVKDDEKEDLDPDTLLRDIRKNDEYANDYRRENGLPLLHTAGWAVPPKYNESTNNLEWGIVLRDESGIENINYYTKLLGRNGFMNVTLVCDPEDLDEILPAYQALLTGHHYNPGKTYAEYQSGDKIAEYGLTALIAGGALYGAAKMGLLANIMLFFKKGFKFIIAGAIALGLGIKKFFSSLTGRGESRRELG